MKHLPPVTEVWAVRLRDGTYRARVRWTGEDGEPREVTFVHDNRAIAIVRALSLQESECVAEWLAVAEVA